MVARTERIPTFAEIPFQIDFHQVGKRPLYQEIAATATWLKYFHNCSSSLRGIQIRRKSDKVD